jgi:hypothetical protein
MRFRDLVIRNIASPYGLAMISYALFLFACLIPPSIYTHYLHEPDLMFLDPATILLYTLCVIAFLAGVRLIGWLFPHVPCASSEPETRISPAVFLLIPLVIGIVLTNLSTFLLVRDNPMLTLMVFAQQGGEIKAANLDIEVESSLSFAASLLTGIILWATWRCSQFSLAGSIKRLVYCALWVAVLSVVLSATLTLARARIMMLFSGMAVLHILRRTFSGQMRKATVVRWGLGFFAGVVAVFFLFSFLRGIDTMDQQVGMFFGYTIGAYNRLAAVVGGVLHYSGSGHGMYLSDFLSFNHSLNRVLPIGKAMGFPDRLEIWSSEFGAVGRAGLDAQLIWPGAFGYIFADLGWFSPLFVFGYGLACGVIWRWMKAGTAIGVTFYPCVAFCILFWLGTNYLLDSESALLFVTALILSAYEGLFVRRRTKEEFQTSEVAVQIPD